MLAFPIYRIETLLLSRENRETLFSIEIIESLLSSTEKGVVVVVAMLVAVAMAVVVAMVVAMVVALALAVALAVAVAVAQQP